MPELDNKDLNKLEKTTKKLITITKQLNFPKKDIENIFEPYFTTKTSGFGLGLANARKIVEQHKGTIHVRTSENSGTTFEIVIPYEEEK